MSTSILAIMRNAAAFESEAHVMLSGHEGSERSRVITLGTLFARATSLGARQTALFEHAMKCAEHGLYLGAYVLVWSAIMDLYEERLSGDRLAAIKKAYD